MRAWLAAGLKPSASTDAPVCDANPFPNIYTMLTRKTGKGTVVGGQQALTIDETLQAYTEFGAFAEKAEGRKGRLSPGLLGDVAVFSRDLTKAAPKNNSARHPLRPHHPRRRRRVRPPWRGELMGRNRIPAVSRSARAVRRHSLWLRADRSRRPATASLGSAARRNA